MEVRKALQRELKLPLAAAPTLLAVSGQLWIAGRSNVRRLVHSFPGQHAQRFETEVRKTHFAQRRPRHLLRGPIGIWWTD